MSLHRIIPVPWSVNRSDIVECDDLGLTLHLDHPMLLPGADTWIVPPYWYDFKVDDDDNWVLTRCDGESPDIDRGKIVGRS